MKPRALDLFCGAGGATKGLQRAGFHVTGVDIRPQPRYCGDAFIQTDVLHMNPRKIWKAYNLVWASPPCQRYTQMLNHGRTSREIHPDLVRETRELLESCYLPFIIENVAGAPLIDPAMLCGEMFGLRVLRHRFFEATFPLAAPEHPKHRPEGSQRKQGDGGYYCRVYGHETSKAQWGPAMGIDWMRTPELTQAIPPAYAEFIGRQVLQNLVLKEMSA